MRFGLIGDVHAEDARLEVALKALFAAGVDRVLCTGDVVDGQGNVDRSCELLARHQVLTVRGNHDRWIRQDDMRALPHAHKMTELSPDSIAMIKSLRSTEWLDLPPADVTSGAGGGGRLLLCHGVGENDMRRLTPDDAGYAISTNEELLELLFDPTVAIMVSGHTHRPMVRRFERGSGRPALIAVNAGTLAREDEPGFVVLDVGARRVDFMRIGDDLAVSTASRAMY